MSLQVFVVDDCRDTTESLRLLIKYWGHDVHVANDGATAIEQAPLFKPDVMFVDLSMPAVDGTMVARQLRLLAAMKNCRLVALTGWADGPHRQQALEAGFDDYLLKPVEAGRLQELLEEGQRVEFQMHQNGGARGNGPREASVRPVQA